MTIIQSNIWRKKFNITLRQLINNTLLRDTSNMVETLDWFLSHYSTFNSSITINPENCLDKNSHRVFQRYESYLFEKYNVYNHPYLLKNKSLLSKITNMLLLFIIHEKSKILLDYYHYRISNYSPYNTL